MSVSRVRRVKRITKSDLEVMFLKRDFDHTKRRKRSTAAEASKKACAICFEEMRSKIKLKCKHEFHKNCLSGLQNPQCPLCRHPIGEDVLDRSTIDAMEQKRRANIVEANAEAAAYYAALTTRLDEKIPIGSDDWKTIVRYMLKYVGCRAISSMYDWNLNLRLHEKLMALTENRHTSMAVENLIVEMQCVYRLSIVRFDVTANRALFDWFLQKIQYTRVSSGHMFNEAHLYFPEISYKTMKQYAFQALKLLYKTSL